MRWSFPYAITTFAIALSMVALLPVTHAAAVTSEYTSQPAHYRFQETIRIQNPSPTPALDVTARVVLLPPSTQYSRVRLTWISHKPEQVIRDTNGNSIGVYHWSIIGARRTVTLTIQYQAVSRAIAYRLPTKVARYQTHSRLFRTYTNPRFEYRQGVNTDAPTVLAVVRKVTRGLTSPVARAKALFVWEADHIRYNPGSGASGSAVATLATRSGVCSDFAELYAALLRTDHIPARLISGYVTNNGGGKAGFHEWDEFYLPQVGWVVADPTWGRFGYFGRLQDDWHVALYGGVVPDVEVRYASHRRDGTLEVATAYHFTTESMSLTRPPRTPLPVLPVALPHNTTLVHLAPSGWHRWLAVASSWFRTVIRRLAHWL